MYDNYIKEFARVRMEQTPNNAQIARDIRNKFNLDKEIDIIRRRVSKWRIAWQIKASEIPIKRLFADIETSYYQLKVNTFQLKNYIRYFDPDTIQKEKQVICIAYKWQYGDEVHTLDWRMGEDKMLKEFIKVMEQADELIFHNADRFDIPFIRTRAIYHGKLMFPNYRTLDTLKKSRYYFKFASNKLDYIGKYLKVGRKLENEGFELWQKVVEGKNEKERNKALNKMISYCQQDVILLEDIFFVLSPFITHNNNFAVLTGGDKWNCPECASKDVEMYRTYSTPMGTIRRNMKCNNCKKQYKISNRTYMQMLEELHRQEYLNTQDNAR